MGFSDAKIAPSPPYTPPGTILMREGFVPQFSTVVPHLRTVPPLAARCSVAAHCASLRVLATSALRAFGRSKARLRLSYVPTIRNSRLATLPLASLLPLSPSLDFRFACSAHCARRSSVPQGARFVRPSRALLGFLTRRGGGISLRLWSLRNGIGRDFTCPLRAWAVRAAKRASSRTPRSRRWASRRDNSRPCRRQRRAG